MRFGPAALGLALAAGCAAPPAEAPSTLFLPDARGLAIVGSTLRIDFGRAPDGVISALARELGPGRPRPLAGCAEGIVQRRAWGALDLTFSRERFVGWQTATAAAGRGCAPAGETASRSFPSPAPRKTMRRERPSDS
ncbi:hypothetical protein SAMN05444722_2699 [Rhodovulum sp. ES.010]|uniref:hypothetical protein n=1 Tax=Rhodovulum sp. ES.010 TaxID=1882821 RepID=UPI000927300E|nr:hypothetical protein [Rhodovulum sp. ES.010]SIO49616.1 hypothetical protein SAMN05444722_2699 [Rhodovulum sp. ES.010]